MKTLWKLSPLLVFAGLTAAALGQDPLEIVKKADAATKAVKAVSFRAERISLSDDEERAPGAKAKVQAKIVKRGEFPQINIKGIAAGRSGDGKQKFQIISDGKESMMVDFKEKKAQKRDAPSNLSVFFQDPRLGLFMVEYAHETPFQDEIDADARKYEGTKKIGDVECHVIHVTYSGGQGVARWYFGTKDGLPRRVDRIAGNFALVLTDVNTKPEFDDDTFALKAPEGIEVASAERPKAPTRPSLLTVGDKAPNWTLKNAAGKPVSLESLRGKVVLLDFWAVWCGPCKKAMPAIQAIHEKFKGKEVAVFGVNAWERETNDPVKFMKDEGYTYGLLLEGDEVAEAYKVSGIPTFYVIGTDGKIVHHAVGFSPDKEEELAKIIEKALEDAQ